MEIILDDISYSSNKQDYLLKNISWTFKNSINFVSGVNAKCIKDYQHQIEFNQYIKELITIGNNIWLF